MDILQMSLSATVMIAAVTIIRALTLHRLPKRTFLALWGTVVCRLLIPFSIPSRLSFYTGLEWLMQLLSAPAAETVTPSAALATGTGTAGVTFSGEAFQEAASSATPAAVSPLLIVWIVGMCVCALFFIIVYLKCRREFKTALPIQNEFTTCWLKEHAPRRTVRLRRIDRVQATADLRRILPRYTSSQKHGLDGRGGTKSHPDPRAHACPPL